MAPEKAPAYQWYVKDWRSSRATMRMTFSERGVYREMLDEQWEAGTLPDSPEAVADLICTSEAQKAEVLAAWTAVRRKFAAVEGQPGQIINLRLESYRKAKRKYRKAAKVGGGARAAAAARDDRGAFIASGSPAVHQRLSSDITSDQPAASPAASQRYREGSSSTATATASSSATATAPAVQDSERVAERAGWLLNRYAELFTQHRRGARLRLLRNTLEFADAQTLVSTWTDDAHLEKLAVLVLTTDDEFISRTDRSFKIFAMKASWADDRLRAWEQEQAATA